MEIVIILKKKRNDELNSVNLGKKCAPQTGISKSTKVFLEGINICIMSTVCLLFEN